MEESKKEAKRIIGTAKEWTLREYFSHILDLTEGLARRQTVQTIRENVDMKGANVWMLIASIFIASIGLDQNSQAVIIGAMLISPLMSPILGVGLGVAINDRRLLSRSLLNFFVAMSVALIVSVVYFTVTPFGDFTEQMEARTQPTLLDVLVAFFGGIAGIVATTRKDRLNAVPGVAIATALMPPLCVAGYGIANGDFSVFWGSFYLFFMNSVFVAIATYAIVRLLNFPYKQYVNKTEKRRNSLMIAIFTILMVVPSAYTLFNVLKEVRTNQNVSQFIDKNFNNENLQVLKWECVIDKKELKVYLVGDYLNSDTTEFYKNKLNSLMKDTFKLELIQMEEPPQDFGKMQQDIQLKVLKEIEAQKVVEEEVKSEKNILQSRLDSLLDSKNVFKQVQKEAEIVFPELNKIKFAPNQVSLEDENIPIFLLDWNKKISKITKTEKKKQLYKYLQYRLQLDTLEMVEY